MILAALAISLAASAPLAPTTAVTALPPGAVTATLTPNTCGTLHADYHNNTGSVLRIDLTDSQANEPPGQLQPDGTLHTLLFAPVGTTVRYGARVWDPTTGTESTVFGTVTMPACLNEAPTRTPVTLIPPETVRRRVVFVHLPHLRWKGWWL